MMTEAQWRAVATRARARVATAYRCYLNMVDGLAIVALLAAKLLLRILAAVSTGYAALDLRETHLVK